MVQPGEFGWCNTDIPCSMDYICEECPFYNKKWAQHAINLEKLRKNLRYGLSETLEKYKDA